MAISNWQLAALVPYDNTVSGLVATNVQAAIDELAIDSGNFIRKNGNSFGEAFSIGSNDNFAVSLEANGIDTVTINPSGPKITMGYASAGNVHQTFINTDGYPASWPLSTTSTKTALFTYGDMANAVDVGDVVACNSAYLTITDSRLYEYLYMNYYFFHVPAGVTGGSIETAYAFFNDMYIESTDADFSAGGGLTGMRSQLRTKNPNVATGIGFFVNTEGFSGTDGLIKDARGLVASVYTSLTSNTTSVTADACRAVGVHVYQINATGSSTDNSAYGILIDDNISQAGTGEAFAIKSLATETSSFEGSVYSGATVVNPVFKTLNFSALEGSVRVKVYGEAAIDDQASIDGTSVFGSYLDATITDSTIREVNASASHDVYIQDTNNGTVSTLYVCANNYLDDSTYNGSGIYPGVYANFSHIQTRNLMGEASGMYAYLYPISDGANNAIMVAKGIQVYVVSGYDFATPWNADFDHAAYGIYADRVRSGGSLLNNKAYLLSVNTNSVKASGANSEAVGIKIQATGVTASGGTNTEAYGIKIDSGAITASGGSGTNTAYAIRVDDSNPNYFEGETFVNTTAIVGDDVRDTSNPYVYKLVVGQSSDGNGTSALTQFNQLTLTGTADGGSLQGAFVSEIIFEHDTGEYTTVKAFRNSAIHNGQGNIDTLTLCEMEFQTQSGIATIGTVGGVVAMQVGVGADNGIIRNATGFQFNSLQAVGSDTGQTHTAMGLFYNLVSVYSSGGDTNESYGIRIGDTGVTATGGITTRAYGIKIDNGAISASGGSGTNTQYAIRVDDTSENYFEGLSTFKSGVKVKDTGAGSTTLSHYQEVAESDLGTLTWTAGVAPSGTITKKYKATRVGNRVDLWCRIEATVAGTAVTAVSFPLPSDTGISTPVAFTGMGNGEQNIVGSGAITVGGTVSTTGPDCSYLGKDGGGVWTVTIVGPSLAADTAYCHLTYFV